MIMIIALLKLKEKNPYGKKLMKKKKKGSIFYLRPGKKIQ